MMNSRHSGSQSQQQSSYSKPNASNKYRNDLQNKTTFGGSLGSIDKQHEKPAANIMYDPRVIRGSTFNLRRQIETRLHDINEQQQQQRRQHRSAKTHNYSSSASSSKYSSMATNRKKSSYRNRKSDVDSDIPITPRPVSGRVHANIQTDTYLEEIRVNKQEQEFGTQTDPFLDRPSTPLFVPKLSGKCVATQIEDGDLFDFDKEVEPILEVLIGKTVEQSLMEVLEEEELKAYARYKAQFEQTRNVELAKCQRMEEEERRRNEEKQRRVEQAEQARKEEQVLKKRIEAQRVAVEFLQNIEEAVFCELDKKGYFADPIKKEIEEVFMPNLMQGIHDQVQQAQMANLVIDDIVEHFVVQMIEQSMQAIRERDAQRMELEREQRYQRELNERFVLKRREFTKAIKSQKEDYDFKEQIVQFLDIPMSVQADSEENKQPADDAEEEPKAEEEEDNDEEEKEEDELPPEIQQNIQFVEELMEQFGNEEEPLWKQISSMMDRIGGDNETKIQRIDAYLEKFRVKECKKVLLSTFEIYKEDDENLKRALIDCLEIDTFDEEQHNKYLEILKSESQKEQMELINELLAETEDVETFVSKFVAQKEEERRKAAEEEAKAKQAEEEAEADDDEQDD